MRTRIYNKMTANEVEAYLARGGDTIFVAVGVVEAHSGMPIDVEQIVPEGYALAMAEKADGLAMINLPYFFPGGTIISNATVQMTVRDSIDYLMKIGRSLVAQGFRKLFFVSCHGPARLYIDPFCRDFFQETKIHAVHINAMMLMLAGKPMGAGPKSEIEDWACGAYKIMGMMDDLPIDPEAPAPLKFTDDMNPPAFRLQQALRTVRAHTSLYYASLEHHCPCRAFHSVEERDAACEKGEREIRELVDRIDFEEIKAAIDGYHAYVSELSEKQPRLKGVN